MWGRGPSEDQEVRFAHLNDPDANQRFRFPNNVVITSKYSVATFLFKNLYEQFRRIANIYFLIISILQVSTDLSPTHRLATAGPLAAVLIANMAKEAFEDLKRHQADDRVNNSLCLVLDKETGAFQERLWKELRVGDVVKISNGEEAPADLLVLATSEESGLCYVETSNLDGESNLKIRQAIDGTQELTEETVSGLEGHLDYEMPNSRLYHFDGTIYLKDQEKSPVDVKSVFLRGARLRNTKYVFGLVVFTGKDTKLSMNSRSAPSKRSDVERTVNVAIIIIFATLFFLCTVGTVANSLWTSGADIWYLPFVASQTDLDTAATWITFLILFNNLVPISLYVSMEVVKLYQARLIDHDIEMYHEETDTPALSRTSNLNEDLGQIEYVFSDKTGTLTRNEMEFRKCSIGGVAYRVEGGEMIVDRDDPPPTSERAPAEASAEELEADLDRDDTDADTGAGAGTGAPAPGAPSEDNAALIHEFLVLLSVCHTVIPEKLDDGTIAYQSASPDEVALVNAAKEMGYELVEASSQSVTIRERGKDQVYQILNVNEFNSTRKRMSVVCRCPDGKLVLYIKGADTVIYQLLAPDQEAVVRLTDHLEDFASEGLRTLVLAKADLDDDFYQEWNQRHFKAATAVVDRDHQLQEVAADIERDLRLIGATAIEDKLQEGVPETIFTLARAGMKIWVLTGDKQETAINIGFSCRLLDPDMNLLIVAERSVEKTRETLNQRRLDMAGSAAVPGPPLDIASSSSQRNKVAPLGPADGDLANAPASPAPAGGSAELALIIDGTSLMHVMEHPDLSELFMDVASRCKAVIACRVSPMQKAQVVRLVKDTVKPTPMTLSIGDGANDVSMIQEAHVGVGISGHEGMQAVRSADYAIAQFRFLQRLLLVHGRWNYNRISKLILYSFYKNIALVLTLFFFVFYNGYSGTTLYESWLGAGWNVGWTLLPIIFIGVLDQDVSANNAQLYPLLYMPGQWKALFNLRVMSRWVLVAAVHSIVVFFVTTTCFGNVITDPDGHTDGLFLMGTITNGAMMMTVNAKVALETNYWTTSNMIVWACSVALWFLFITVYSVLYFVSPDFYYIGFQVMSRPVFWLVIPLAPLICFLFDMSFKYYRRTYHPTPVDIVQELEHGYRAQANMGDDDPANGPPGLPGGESRVFLRRATVRNTATFSGFAFSYPTWDDETNHPNEIWGTLSSDQLRQQKEAHREQNAQMHKWTLEFDRLPRLEHSFHDYYYSISVKQSRWSLTAVEILIVIYMIWEFTTQELTRGFYIRLGGSLLGLFPVAFAWTSHFSDYHQVLLATVSFIGGVAKTIAISDSGILANIIFPLLPLVVFRLRFKTGIVIVLVDFCIYMIFLALVVANQVGGNQSDVNQSSIDDDDDGDFGLGDMAQTAMFLTFAIIMSAYGAYNNEIAIRRDFLLQRGLNRERQQSKNVLSNMLPKHVTRRMKKGQRIIADDEERVTILFCDIQEFSQLVLQHSPSQFVTLLDGIYSTFDNVCGRYGVQKMETVGPTYMACSGLQDKTPLQAQRCAETALAMLDAVQTFKAKDGSPIRVRIGIHTGRVISGVVGVKKPQFSLFGDTVNTASRMQATGEVDRIQVSAVTYEELQDKYDFDEPRLVKVKGKGEMQCYMLVSRKDGVEPPDVFDTEAVTVASRMASSSINLDDPRLTGAKSSGALLSGSQEMIKMATSSNGGDGSSSERNKGSRASTPMLGAVAQGNSAQVEDEDDNELLQQIEATPLHRFSMRYVGHKNLEERFQREQDARMIHEIRICVFLSLIGYAGYGVIEYFQFFQDDDSQLAATFGVRYGYVGVSTLFLLYSFRKSFAAHRQTSASLLYFVCAVGIMMIAVVKDDTFEHNTTIVSIWLTYLIFNIGGVSFFAACLTNYGSMVVWLITAMANSSRSQVDQESSMVLFFFFFLFASCVLNSMAARAREFYQRRTFLANQALVIETARSDQLLHQMLPDSVIHQLKDGRTVIADLYEDGMILFSDIVGFTSKASTTAPSKVVELLSTLFGYFDQLTETHGVYKVQTIGDAYVVVAGIPVTKSAKTMDKERAAQAILAFALDMLKTVDRVSKEKDMDLKMRIGIHMGRIVAGVIGTKILRYDIWGGDVLVAASMESHGAPMRISVSEAFKRQTEKDHDFDHNTSVTVLGSTVEAYLLSATETENHIKGDHDLAVVPNAVG